MKIDKEMIKRMLAFEEPDKELKSYKKIELYDLSYIPLSDEENECEIIRQLERNKADNKVVGGDDRKIVWENGWKENYDELINSRNIDALMPKYFRKDQPFRLFERFVHSDNFRLDFELGRVLKSCVFEYYLEEYDSIYEFGCGTGFNLVECASMYPEKKLYGLDYTSSSKSILHFLHDNMGYNIVGETFDFFNPNYDYHLDGNSAVYTIAALEQVGLRWDSFLNYLLVENPRLVVHMEPIEELYDDKNKIIDWCALDFHKKRNYLSGYYTGLINLEKEGKIRIITAHRIYFGNLNDESYSLVIWKPLEK